MRFLHVGQKGLCLAMLIVAHKETNHEKKQLIKYKEEDRKSVV